MTQSSVAISADGNDWAILNASPDIRAQMDAQDVLHPATLRGSPMKAMVLTNGDIDHIAGLLTLREGTPFTIFATAQTQGILQSPVFNVLKTVTHQTIRLDEPFALLPGLTATAFAVPGKVALFLEENDDPDTQAMGEQTVGLWLQTTTANACYIPGCAALPDWLVQRIATADLLLFDGTVWQDDEMSTTGTGAKTGARMGHIAMTQSLDRLTAPAKRTYIHINNTNPVLQPASPERAAVLAAGWTIAHDGMELSP